MPRHLLLEGSDPQALMMRVREELGPEARVIRAEEVRSGGVLGFFARRHYELTVEVPDAGERPARPAAATPEVTSDALAQEIADAKAARDEMLSGTAHLASRAQEAAETAKRAAGPEAPVPSPVTYDEAPPAVVESTDMAEFDRLVLRLTREAEEGAPAEPVTRAPSPAAPEAFRPAAFPIADRDSATVVGSAREEVAQRPAPDQPQPASPATGGISVRGTVLHRSGAYADIAAAGRAASGPALRALGVPSRFLADGGLGEEPLLDVIERFEVPGVRRPEEADLVVIAGPADQAVRVATQVAAWLGLEQTAVVLAGDIQAIRGHGRRIVTEDSARAARRRAHAAGAQGHPLIVALGVGSGPRGAAEALPMLEAFDADTLWWVADASRRVSALNTVLSVIAQWRPVDGVAAFDLAQAQAPAAMLDADAPLTWMDGLPAASVVWAALLSERLAELED